MGGDLNSPPNEGFLDVFPLGTGEESWLRLARTVSVVRSLQATQQAFALRKSSELLQGLWPKATAELAYLGPGEAVARGLEPCGTVWRMRICCVPIGGSSYTAIRRTCW